MILFIIASALYFMPTIWAYKINHRNKEAILLTNLFLGWTGIGWVVALIWSSMKD